MALYLNSNDYWPPFTAVFGSCQIWLCPGKISSDKNGIFGKSRKRLQFCLKCTFMIFLSVKSWLSRYFLIKSNVYKNLEKSFLEVFGAEKSRTQHFSSGKSRSVSPTVIVFVYLVKIGKLNLADLIVKNGLRLRDIVGKIAFGASRHYYQNIRRWLEI